MSLLLSWNNLEVRGTTRASVSILIAKYKDILQENYGDQEDELMAMLESLKTSKVI